MVNTQILYNMAEAASKQANDPAKEKGTKHIVLTLKNIDTF